jgi:hypothetical protein
MSKALVRGPQPAAATAKPDEQKKSSISATEENKGVLDQMKQDLDSVGKMLNPFRW